MSDDLERIKKLAGLPSDEVVGRFFNKPITKKYLEELAKKPKKKKRLDEFAKSNREDDDGDSTVIDKPDLDVDINDLTASRNELLKIMKRAGQSAGDSDKPAGWNLVLYDDPVTPGDAVIDGLKSVMGMGDDEVGRVIQDCQRNGQSVLKTYAVEDVALSKQRQLKSSIDNNRSYRGGNGTNGPWDVQIEVLKAGD